MLAEECEVALHEILPDDTGTKPLQRYVDKIGHTNRIPREWHDINLKQFVRKLVARLSSRVFLGEQICRNPEWLKIAIDYTVEGFAAADELRLWPACLRPIVLWFLPSCRRLRAQVAKSRNIINPVLEKRRKENSESRAEGRSEFKHTDAIDWFEQISNGRYYDPVAAQLNLSLAAIHTTSELVTQVIYDLITNPDVIKPLREEIDNVLADGGWKKSSLYNMKLLDSVLKETQRLQPGAICKFPSFILLVFELCSLKTDFLANQTIFAHHFSNYAT